MAIKTSSLSFVKVLGVWVEYDLSRSSCKKVRIRRGYTHIRVMFVTHKTTTYKICCRNLIRYWLFIQSQFYACCWIWASEKLIQPSFAFPPFYRDFYRLLIATFKGQWVPRMLFVL